MSAESNKALVRQFVEEAQSGHDLTAVDRYLAPDFVDHSSPAGLPPTREGVKMQFGMFFSAIPDMRAVIHAQVADDDTVVTRKTLSGTHQGALFGVPPTGQPVAIEVIDILRVSDGRITDHWNQVDRLGLMQQLGALPA